MRERITKIIEYYFAGDKNAFCAKMGWKRQYLDTMLRIGNIGLTPVSTILRNLPDLSGRWLVIGDGQMIKSNKAFDIAKENIIKVITLEKYTPFMTGSELRAFQNGKLDFPDVVVNRWKNENNNKTIF